jgi:hypothetical protein
MDELVEGTKMSVLNTYHIPHMCDLDCVHRKQITRSVQLLVSTSTTVDATTAFGR